MNVYVPVASAASPFTPPRRQAPATAPNAVALLASVALFHVFTHVRVISAGYDLGRLEAEQRRLVAERDHLRMEVATLRAAGQLEKFARAQLQMAPPAPGAVVAGRAGVAAAGRGVRAGMADGRHPAPAEPLSSGARIALRGAERSSEVR